LLVLLEPQLLAAEAQAGSGSYMPLVLIVLLFALMYFMMIRPQQKRRREALEMQSALGPGDTIETIGGLQATVVSIDDEIAVLEIHPGVNATYTRRAIARTIKKVDEPAVAEEPVAEAAEEPAVEPAPLENPVVETRKNKD
jgi:preprotein translocase subunit YajC